MPEGGEEKRWWIVSQVPPGWQCRSKLGLGSGWGKRPPSQPWDGMKKEGEAIEREGGLAPERVSLLE